MQRVVRSTFAVLTLAGLAACGDKVTVIQPDTTKPPGQVTAVTVTPSTVSLSPQQTASLVATVTADPSITDRTVTWSSSNTAVVTVSSAGPSTQVTITAVAAGTAAIVARSNASNVVSGAAAVTVTALPPVSVSIGSINQGANITGLIVGVPADLTNAQGQLDITLNVESGNLPLQSVTTILRCGTDSIVQTQTISAAVAELAAEEAAVPVTLSVNTSQLNAAGTAPLLRNNQACTVRAIARTTSGTQSASGTTTLTVNNPDMILATITFPRQAADPLARPWYGGPDAPVTVVVRPILFSGRTAVSASVTFNNLGKTQTTTTAPFTLSWPTSLASATAGDPNSLWGFTVFQESLSISVLDNQGNTIVGSPNFGLNPLIVTFASTTPSTTVTPPGQTPTSGVLNGTFARFNLDVSPPEVDDLNVNFNSQNATNGYIGTGFSFAPTSDVFFASALNTASPLNSLGYANTTATSSCTTVATATAIADGALCDNGGVDRVTLTTQFTTSSPASGTSTFTTFTAISAIPETASGTAYGFRIQACDALQNCNNTTPTQLGRFGVDLVAPTLVTTSGPTNNGVYGIGSVVPGGASFAISDPQGAGGVAGSGGASPAALLVTLQGLVPSGATGSATTCFVGQLAAGATSGPCANAITQVSLVGTGGPINGQANVVGTSITLPTGPGEYTLTVRALDQAGNQSAPTTIRWYVDQAAPTVAAGVAIPAAIVGGSTFTVTAADNMDVAAGNGYLQYPVGFRFFEAGTASPAGVTFDNALTRSSTVTVPLAVWFRSLTTTIGTAGVKPDVLGLRAIDAASNLSNPEIVNLPPLNIANGTTISGTGANGITSQVLTASPTTIWAGGTAAPTPGTTTLTYTVQALTQQTGTPFSQACFYYRAPTGAQGGASGPGGAATGDLVQIGCTSTVLTTTPNATDKFFTYTTTWTPPLALGGTAPQVFAVGVTSATDAIISAPVVVTINVLP
jgi:predicted small lipoprotein YifL